MAVRPGDVVKWALLGTLTLLALVHASDFLWLRFRMAYPKTGKALDTVLMDRLYAIPQKNGKVEYEFDAQQPQVSVPCVRALLPHMGYSPCWYLQRNSQKPIPMTIMLSVRQ